MAPLQIRYIGYSTPYSMLLDEIQPGQNMYARVKVVDFNGGTAYTSPPQAVQVPHKCQAPRTPPSDLRAQGSAPTQMRVTWTVLYCYEMGFMTTTLAIVLDGAQL